MERKEFNSKVGNFSGQWSGWDYSDGSYGVFHEDGHRIAVQPEEIEDLISLLQKMKAHRKANLVLLWEG